MYSRWQLAIKYLKHYLNASNRKGHGIHSPFVFEFITKILNDKKKYDAYDVVENLRKQLLIDSRLLTVEDFGAGSKKKKKYQRGIKYIAQNSAKSGSTGNCCTGFFNFTSLKRFLSLEHRWASAHLT